MDLATAVRMGTNANRDQWNQYIRSIEDLDRPAPDQSFLDKDSRAVIIGRVMRSKARKRKKNGRN